MTHTHQTLPPSIAARLLESLATGLNLAKFAIMLNVGRLRELRRVNDGLQHLKDGGSVFQIVIGSNGAGKTHFFDITEQAALSQGLVVSRLDMRPEFRLQGNDKDSRALISAVILGLKVKDCGASDGLGTILTALKSRITDGRIMSPEELTAAVWEHCRELTRQRLGDTVVEVVAAYLAAVEAHDTKRQARLLRWLRAGYDTRAAAAKETGINAVIDGDSFLDYLRLLALLCRLAGFGGLLVLVDEMILLTRSTHGRDRDQNFDSLLGIVNATAKGHAPSLGLFFGGTPDFLEHHSRGVLSHEALRTRLQEVGGNNALVGPVIRLQLLTPEELFLLLRRARALLCPPAFIETRLPDEALKSILTQNFKRLGAAETVTPREVLQKLAHVIAMLNQSPKSKWQDALQRNSPTTDNRNSTTKTQP